MSTKQIHKVIFAPQHQMGNMVIKQPLPSVHLDYLDPFVLLHHGKNVVPEDFDQHHDGVDPHPHRGFAPVTFVFEGGVQHQDSRGNKQSVLKGGVQWMNAGMGIVHSERPAVAGLQEIIQMWVNVPASHKMDQPTYYPINQEDMPAYQSEDKKVAMYVVSGELLGLKGLVPTYTSINSAMVWAEKGGKLSFDIPAGQHSFLYLLDGQITIGGQDVNKYHMVVFEKEGTNIAFEVTADAKLLFMSGESIGESIVAKGPFVMNSETEIMEAYRDYRMGKLGVLIEE
jgi:quercetin 2,3-dioxygenase